MGQHSSSKNRTALTVVWKLRTQLLVARSTCGAGTCAIVSTWVIIWHRFLCHSRYGHNMAQTHVPLGDTVTTRHRHVCHWEIRSPPGTDTCAPERYGHHLEQAGVVLEVRSSPGAGRCGTEGTVITWTRHVWHWRYGHHLEQARVALEVRSLLAAGGTVIARSRRYRHHLEIGRNGRSADDGGYG